MAESPDASPGRHGDNAGESAESDVSIVGRILQQDDAAAFRLLVDRYKNMLAGLFWRATGSLDDSEELVQETFCKAWSALPSYRPENKFHTWLYTIALNLLRTHLKRGKLKRMVFLPGSDTTEARIGSVPDHAHRPEKAFDDNETSRIVRDLLGRLKEQQRLPLILHYFDGYGIQEISEIMRMPENTVKTNLRRGREEIERMITVNPSLTAFFAEVHIGQGRQSP